MLPRQQALGFALLIGAGLTYWWWSQKRRGSSAQLTNGSVLETYTKDLTKEAESHKLDPVVGREEEIERMTHILSRRTKNNPLLLGEPGVGKTAVVEGIACKIVSNDVPDTLAKKRVLSLDLGALIGGTKYRGEFEQRMKKLTNEITAMGRTIILFIDEIHMIAQAKGAEGALNISDIIKPALARGDLQLIGATTWHEYEQFIKKDDALNRRLQPVVIGEPSLQATLQILRGIKEIYEKHHHVHYMDKALKAAVQLSKDYIKDRFLPDKAIDLLDEAGAKVSIDATHTARHAMGLLHAAGAEVGKRLAVLEEEKKQLRQELDHLKRLEQDIDQESELKEIRLRMEHLVAYVEKVDADLRNQQQGGTPEVGELDIRAVVSEWIGQPLLITNKIANK